MDRRSVIREISQRLKLIRVEMNYSQEQMADILGLSKKTLVDIEKGRKNASWAVVVAVCALMPESEIIHGLLGEDPLSYLQVLIRDSIYTPKVRTMGGKVWWNDVETTGSFRIQQNVISGHFRILDADNYRWFSTFSKDEALKCMSELTSD
ncbi:MAG: helix-turn-helix domain-containing protein [Syntrophomonadaceae bacterium]